MDDSKIQGTHNKEEHIKRLYGKAPTKAQLLHQQLEGRTYFDSGDFALSQAQKSSDIGSVETGKKHPVRENIAQPSAPAPASSNFQGYENEHDQSTERSSEAASSSRLHEETTFRDDKVAKQETNV